MFIWRLRWALRPCRGVRLPPLKGPVQGEKSLAILFVAHVFQPIDDLTVELFLDGDMRHGRGRRGTVPMLLARREPDHVTGMDFLDRAALPLDPAATGDDDEGLPQRVGVPRRPGRGLERDAGTGRACWSLWLEKRVDADRASEPVGRPFSGRLGANSFDFHVNLRMLRWRDAGRDV